MGNCYIITFDIDKGNTGLETLFLVPVTLFYNNNWFTPGRLRMVCNEKRGNLF
jgi:hypothetical protein